MSVPGSGTNAGFPTMIVGLCGVLLAGCASLFGVHVETARLVPAASHEAATVRQVAVLAFEGPDGERVADELLALLASVEVDGRPYFELIDRDRLPPAIAQGQAGLPVPPVSARPPGRQVVPAGYYAGRVEDIRVSSRTDTRESRACAERREGRCVRWVVERVLCRVDSAHFAFVPRLVEGRTGRVVFARTFAGSASADSCSGSPRPSRAELLAAAKQIAYAEFRSHVAPQVRQFTVRLIDADPRLTDPPALAAFNRGIEQAKARQMEAACATWASIRDTAGSSFALAYDLGVCEEMAGRFDAAAKHYESAERLAGEPNELIAAARERVRQLVDDARRLESQLKR